MSDPKYNIRPSIDGLVPATTPAEQFQNETLRPILKLQNDLLLVIFANDLQRKKVPFGQFPILRRLEWIEHSLQKDQRLRQLLLGIVIGHFTVAEWQSYQVLETELARRTVTMLIQRLQSQAEVLSAMVTPT